MRGGIYRTGGLTLNQGITLQPYLSERPILKGTEVPAKWETLRNNVWRTPWKKLFPAAPLSWWQRRNEGMRTPLHRFNNDMVFLDGEMLRSEGWEGGLDAHSYYIDYAGGYVYIGVNPANRLVEITAFDGAIVRTSAEVHGKVSDRKGPVIRGITFTQYAYRALEVEGKKHFTSTDEPTDEPVGLADPATFGKEVIGTVLENPNSAGVWYDVGNRDGVFMNNYVEGATNGFMFEISRGVTVAGNVFVRCDRGIYILNAADARVYNNTFVDAPASFERNQRSATGDLFGWHPATGPDVDQREGHVFVNNLMVAGEAYRRPLLQFAQPAMLCTKLPRPQAKEVGGNVYVRATASGSTAAPPPLVV